MIYERRRGEYRISADPAQLDIAAIHSFLSRRSYWAMGRSLKAVKRSIEHSVTFGIYRGGTQVGFARVVTDYSTFAWLADVFVLEEFRGLGLGKWLVDEVITHPELQGLRRWLLATRDAHGLYRRVGFTELENPQIWMTRSNPVTPETPDGQSVKNE